MLLRLRAEQLVALLARRERPRERFVLRMFVASVSCVRSDRMRILADATRRLLLTLVVICVQYPLKLI